MQVSVRRSGGAIALVAFEFGVVRAPHELLQDVSRVRVWRTNDRGALAKELRVALMDKHRGLLGRRGNLWSDPFTYEHLRGLFEEDSAPWERKQELDPGTVLWLARRAPPARFRVPSFPGLNPGEPLHDAVQQAVLIQGAFRALSLKRDPPTKSGNEK